MACTSLLRTESRYECEIAEDYSANTRSSKVVFSRGCDETRRPPVMVVWRRRPRCDTSGVRSYNPAQCKKGKACTERTEARNHALRARYAIPGRATATSFPLRLIKRIRGVRSRYSDCSKRNVSILKFLLIYCSLYIYAKQISVKFLISPCHNSKISYIFHYKRVFPMI